MMANFAVNISINIDSKIHGRKKTCHGILGIRGIQNHFIYHRTFFLKCPGCNQILLVTVFHQLQGGLKEAPDGAGTL